MKRGRIAAVEFLTKTANEDRIAESKELFDSIGKPKGADGFEVWDGPRFIYRYPPKSEPTSKER